MLNPTTVCDNCDELLSGRWEAGPKEQTEVGLKLPKVEKLWCKEYFYVVYVPHGVWRIKDTQPNSNTADTLL